MTALDTPRFITESKSLVYTNQSVSIEWGEVARAYEYEARITNQPDKKPKKILASMKNKAEWRGLQQNTMYVIEVKARLETLKLYFLMDEILLLS